MSRYKDRYGNPIKVGDTVLQLISMNMERHSSPYTVMIIKKEKNKLILDGVWGRGYLSTQDPQHLCTLTPETDIRKVHVDFIKMQESIDSYGDIPNINSYYKYLPNDAYKDLEKIAKIMGFKEYAINKDTIKDIISSIDLFFSDKEIDKTQVDIALKTLKAFEQSVIDVSNLSRTLYKIRVKKEVEE